MNAANESATAGRGALGEDGAHRRAQRGRTRALAALALAALSGCAVGNVRHHEMGALSEVSLARVRIEEPASEQLSFERRKKVQSGVAAVLTQKGLVADVGSGEAALKVVPEVLDAREAQEAAGATSGAVSAAASFLGVSGQVEDASRVTLRLTLLEQGSQEPLGAVLWQGAEPGPLERQLDRATREATETLAADIERRKELFAPRVAGDERFLFTPSALLLEPGEVVLSNDEALLFHLGVGLSKWVQLNLSLGGLPIPGAGAVPFAGHGVAVAGGAGVILLGAVDVGLKVKVLDESRYVPSLAVSADLLDLFGAALGAGGIGLLGNGVAAAGGAGAAGINVQLNVFSVAANKHLLRWLQVGGGLGVIDNHHLLPQSAGFVVATTVGGSSGSKTVDMMPTAFLPFVNAEVRLARWAFLIQEVFPGANTVGLTGLRLVLGGGEGTWGPLALSKLRLKIDLAGVETYVHGATAKESGFAVLPWLSLGVYAL